MSAQWGRQGSTQKEGDAHEAEAARAFVGVADEGVEVPAATAVSVGVAGAAVFVAVAEIGVSVAVLAGVPAGVAVGGTGVSVALMDGVYVAVGVISSVFPPYP
jgi:hypothetical protein